MALKSEFENNLQEVQEYYDQLKRTMKLSYDAKLHMIFTEMYSNFIKEVINSDLDEDSKLGYVARLHDIFE